MISNSMTAPTIAAIMLHNSPPPPMPSAPKINPPMRAPTTPTIKSPINPKATPLTNTSARKPAIRPISKNHTSDIASTAM